MDPLIPYDLTFNWNIINRRKKETKYNQRQQLLRGCVWPALWEADSVTELVRYELHWGFTPVKAVGGRSKNDMQSLRPKCRTGNVSPNREFLSKDCPFEESCFK